jgi:hypothetical protein
MQALTRCNACDHEMSIRSLLTATNPFDPADTIYGCPHCCQCTEGFTMLCDENGCHRDVTSGWPSPAGYRHTCHIHWEKTPR